MISPAFLIKILGCTTVGAFLTIGVPVMVVKKNKAKKAAAADKAKAPAIQTKIDNSEITAIEPSESETTEVIQRKVEIDESTKITSLLTSLGSATSPELNPGETFSKKAIEAWTPNTTEKTAIATNFSEITKHMPNEFFEKLKDKNLTKAQGVCHIMTYNTKIGSKGPISLYIPFLKSKLTSTIKNRLNIAGDVTAKADSIDTHIGQFLTTNKANFKKQLTAIVAGTQVPTARAPYHWYHYAWRHQTSTEEKAIAKDLLFLQTLYEDTITRLTEGLRNQNTSHTTAGGKIWELSC